MALRDALDARVDVAKEREKTWLMYNHILNNLSAARYAATEAGDPFSGIR